MTDDHNGNNGPLVSTDQRHRYQLADDGDLCVYCGAPATAENHVPALSYAETHAGPFWTYPACSTCIEMLGPLPDTCIEDRRGFIADLHDLNEKMGELKLYQFQHFPSQRRNGPTAWHRTTKARADYFWHTLPNILSWQGCRCGECVKTTFGGGYYSATQLDRTFPGWADCLIQDEPDLDEAEDEDVIENDPHSNRSA